MRVFKIIAIFITLSYLTACQQKQPTDLTINNIIPKPVNVEATGGSFRLKSDCSIFYDSEELSNTAELLKSYLSPTTGFELVTKKVTEAPESGIFLTLNDTKAPTQNESYQLDISDQKIVISAKSQTAIFWGIQTLRQIFPNAIESNTVQPGPWEIPTGKIVDFPRYSYRGSMLDVSRHFFTASQAKRYIDLIAGLKMNVLHLHLTDDQGWRIEIKSWPKLTTHGGKTAVGGGKGGFYTQEQYKDIVKYAADRSITIIPEIDVPSHTYAALASYPELNCDGKLQSKIEATGTPLDADPYTGMEVGFCTLCTDKPIVDQFMSDVIRELAEMTPGDYIHMGGDESHVTPLEDYIPFMEKIQQMVIDNGKTMIGWDEVANISLDKSTVIQVWSKAENGLKSVEKGAKLIMSPANKAYLDMQYDSLSTIGLHWAGYVDVDSAYLWDPATFQDGITDDFILGIEAPLWSETVSTMDDIEYLTFPRIMGHAEIGWSQAASKDWEDYKIRLGNQASRLKGLGVDYFESKTVPWKN